MTAESDGLIMASLLACGPRLQARAGSATLSAHASPPLLPQPLSPVTLRIESGSSLSRKLILLQRLGTSRWGRLCGRGDGSVVTDEGLGQWERRWVWQWEHARR